MTPVFIIYLSTPSGEWGCKLSSKKSLFVMFALGFTVPYNVTQTCEMRER